MTTNLAALISRKISELPLDKAANEEEEDQVSLAVDDLTLAITRAAVEEENDRAQNNDQVFSKLVVASQTNLMITPAQANSTNVGSHTNSMAVINQANSRLIALPPELQLRVFDLLDRCSSTCLGLTTRIFYRLHRAARGKVPLCAFYFIPGAPDCRGFRLHVLLKEWIGPELMYCEIRDKFVSRTSLEIERIERANIPKNPCIRYCCHGLNPESAIEIAGIQRRDNQEKRKDAKEAGKASCWWV